HPPCRRDLEVPVGAGAPTLAGHFLTCSIATTIAKSSASGVLTTDRLAGTDQQVLGLHDQSAVVGLVQLLSQAAAVLQQLEVSLFVQHLAHRYLRAVVALHEVPARLYGLELEPQPAELGVHGRREAGEPTTDLVGVAPELRRLRFDRRAREISPQHLLEAARQADGRPVR